MKTALTKEEQGITARNIKNLNGRIDEYNRNIHSENALRDKAIKDIIELANKYAQQTGVSLCSSNPTIDEITGDMKERVYKRLKELEKEKDEEYRLKTKALDLYKKKDIDGLMALLGMEAEVEGVEAEVEDGYDEEDEEEFDFDLEEDF